MYFPTPLFPNEHLWGLIGRKFKLSGKMNILDVVKDIKLSTHYLRPNRFLSEIDDQILHFIKYEITEAILTQHTLAYYFKVALSTFENQQHDALIKDGFKTSFIIKGQYSIANTFWRWCKTCNLNDEEKYGISYFHRDHQIPGTFHCPIHDDGLCGQCDHCGFMALDLKNLPIPPLSGKCPRCRSDFKPYSGFFNDQMRQIEMNCRWLCSNQHSICAEDLTIPLVKFMGLSDPIEGTMGSIKIINEFNKSMLSEIDPRVISAYFPKLIFDNNKKSPLLNSSRLFNYASILPPAHPLAHLLILNHCGIELQELFTAKKVH